MTLTVGSLFSGIGGLDLGLERAGMTVRWQSEIHPYCSRVLAKHWPTVPNLGDVTKIEWSEVERVDLICGGYPCQPFSLAGARRGEDDAKMNASPSEVARNTPGLGAQVGGTLNPTWVEWLMGFPLGWTDLED